MTKKILLDTSILIDFLRNKKKENSILYKLVEEKHYLFVSIVTHTELFAGKSVWEQKQAQKELHNLFSGIEIIPLDENISKLAGKIRVKSTPDLIDAIIAATAIIRNLPLITMNLKHFNTIPELKFYQK